VASPQLENGFTRICNELLEALCKSDFTATELKVCLAVIRLTYGFQKKSSQISSMVLAKSTSTDIRFIWRTVSKLEEMKVLKVSRNVGKTNVITLNKDYEKWEKFNWGSGLQTSGPQTSGLQASGPQTSGPQTRGDGPQTSGPQTSGLQTSGPQASGPQTRGPSGLQTTPLKKDLKKEDPSGSNGRKKGEKKSKTTSNGKSKESPKDPRHQPFVEHYWELYQDKFGRKPVVHGKEWLDFGKFLKVANQEDYPLPVLTMAADAMFEMDEDWVQDNISLSLFCRHIHKFIKPLPEKSATQARVLGPHRYKPF
jgi:phage replication O-like protein O